MSNSFLFHMVELFLVIQTGEGLNFAMDLFKHGEEASRTFLIVWTTFHKIAADVVILLSSPVD